MGGKYELQKQDVNKRAVVEAGKGVPQRILDKIAATTRLAGYKTTGDAKLDRLLSAPFKKKTASNVPSNSSTVASAFSEFSMRMNLDEYEFPEEDTIDPHKTSVNLDVTALDRYNEDVRKYRRSLLDDCRLLPLNGEVDKTLLERIMQTTTDLCRTCYYGTYKAHSLAETSMVLLVWLLNRRNVPIAFQIKIMQCISEMVWTSINLKLAFVRAYGIKILVRLLRLGMAHNSQLACWSTYTLLASAIGCGEVIAITQDYAHMDEYVGEMTFPHYWREWPANFGSILQGVLFGPSSVSPVEEEYVFL